MINVLSTDGTVTTIDADETVQVMYESVVSEINLLSAIINAHRDTLEAKKRLEFLFNTAPEARVLNLAVHKQTEILSKALDKLKTLQQFKTGLEPQYLEVTKKTKH